MTLLFTRALSPLAKRSAAQVFAFSVRAAFACAFCLCSFAGAAKAQTTSTILGTVTDHQGLAITGANLKLEGDTVATTRETKTDSLGAYQFPAVPAGTYKLTVSHDGFSTRVLSSLEVTLNKTVTLNVQLEVGQIQERVEVSAALPLLEVNSSSSGATILPDAIADTPLNGRNYLDLLQLVPGVAINRQADTGSDTTTPVLGERANNTGFLIDGLPNQNEVNGGAASPFNQDTIAEFQVITTGYKAEFGHASGGVVNVITKSGGNTTHGLASAYHRSNVLDSNDIPGTNSVPYLLRWDYDAAAGGAIVKDRVFWFGSAERIHENRHLNFTTVAGTPQFLTDQEAVFDTPETTRETRIFGKLDEVLANHHLTEQVNYTNGHINNTEPLSASGALPSTRTNVGDRTLQLGFSDTATFGDSGNPFILSLRGQYRREKTLASPTHASVGANIIFNVFSSFNTLDPPTCIATGGAQGCGLFGDVAQSQFGALFSPSALDQQYTTVGTSLAKTINRHTLKFGWDFERTHVDGNEANASQNQLFATEADYLQFGPANAGFALDLTFAGPTAQANQIKLRNNYNGLWVQDDWKVTRKLTINAGVRWDYDSQFKQTNNVSPRLGFAWSVTPKTVIRGSWGLFYDHFRLGIARDVPGFGGASLVQAQPLIYPRLFSGVPTSAPVFLAPNLCLSPTLTDAQIAAAGAKCPLAAFFGPQTFYGIDHLNNLGPTPIPINSVVNIGNIQQLSGLTPDAYLAAADAAIGQPAGFWEWTNLGQLGYNVTIPGNYPVTIDPSFSTPYTRSLTFGIQRQVSNDAVFSADYYHKGIENILGTRETDLSFLGRVGGGPRAGFVNGYGPWFSGTYDAGIFAFTKRMSHRFTIGGSYAYVSEHDDALCADVGTTATSAGCYPTDSFIGIAPPASSPVGTAGGKPCGGTNATASFFTCSGNFVPVAGKFYNGPSLDSGPSDFAVRNTFEVHGLVQLPWKIQFSGLFRAQSGFRYSQVLSGLHDQDGNGQTDRGIENPRNGFTAPAYVNMDMRVSRTWVFHERFKLQGLFEFFNLLNRGNPAAVQVSQDLAAASGGTAPLGSITQRLPGREGQVGLKLEF
jgi:hypothetical protein